VLDLVRIERDGSVALAGATPAALAEACLMTSALYAKVGYEPPWTGYCAVQGDEPVGTCAFKGPPCERQVEIAYFTLPAYEGRGVGTAMARALVGIARAAQPDVVVTAQTLPHDNASTAILRKLGFARVGVAPDPDAGEVWAWQLEPERAAR
jgi:RimJ/RimL family protein N-acetyltransferase